MTAHDKIRLTGFPAEYEKRPSVQPEGASLHYRLFPITGLFISPCIPGTRLQWTFSEEIPVPDSSAYEQLLQTAGIKLVPSAELYPAQHPASDTGLPMLVVENRFSRAVIALQGAQLMAFQPRGKREMLWVSPKCIFRAGKALRGGIPLCLPWFGPSADGSMQHGFGRIKEWSVVAAESCADGSTRIVLELAGDDSLCTLWPHAFVFRLEVAVGAALQLTLRVENRSAVAAPFSSAFHAYFAVPHVAEARVAGLEGLTYIDKMDDSARKVQQGEVSITEQTDRVYLDAPATQTLRIASGDVKIESDAKCTVVWNCWDNDRNMADIGEGNHTGYLCVEPGDVAERAAVIPADGEYRKWMKISC
jgi:glucose-6-phosphate 1-epimerase